MRIVTRLFRHAWYVLNRSRLERELDEEMETHRALMDDPHRFGKLTRVREDAADVFGWTHLDDLLRDVRYSARTLLRSPSFIVAVVSLGLAIGATAAVYSTEDWLLRRSPGGVVDPGELVTVRITEKDRVDLSPNGYGFSYPQYRALRDVQDTFTDIATYGKLVGVVSTDTRSDQVVVEYVTGSYFPLLGVRPLLGRLLSDEDDVPGSPPNVVLSHPFWHSQFGGDSQVVGRSLRINGVLTRVVGVLPQTFEGYGIDWNGPSAIWAPLAVAQALGNPGILTRTNVSFFPILGRLKSGVAATAIRDHGPAWLSAIPSLKMPAWTGNQVMVRPSSETRIGSRRRAEDFLGVILIVCVLILLAACINMANVLLGRAMDRRREFSLRTALGAGRRRLALQLATEGLVIGVIAGVVGAVIGVAVAAAMATLPRIYLNLLTATAPVTTFGAIDARLVGLAFAIGLTAAVVFGFVPLVPLALRPESSLVRDTPSKWTWGRLRLSTRQLVLMCQVALAISLAATAGLYGRTFLRAASVRAPYDKPESVLVARVALTALTPAERKVLWPIFLARLNDEPGVVSATVGWNPPYRIGFTRLQLPGGDPTGVQVSSTAGAPGFFAVQGIPVVEGREFLASGEDQDTGLIINRVLARQLWPGQHAVGQTVILAGATRTITGVVADDHCDGLLEEAVPCQWQPWPPDSGTSYLRIRTAAEPMAFVGRVRELLRELAPSGALAEASSMDVMLSEIIEPQRNAALIAATLASFGVLLLVVGTGSLFLSMVRDSRREIAVRMAIGATHGMVVRRVLMQGAVVVVAGGSLGIAVAYYLAQQIADQLFQVAPTDSMSLVFIPIVVAVTAFVSIAVAAREAARTDLAPQLKAQ